MQARANMRGRYVRTRDERVIDQILNETSLRSAQVYNDTLHLYNDTETALTWPQWQEHGHWQQWQEHWHDEWPGYHEDGTPPNPSGDGHWQQVGDGPSATHEAYDEWGASWRQGWWDDYGRWWPPREPRWF